MYIHPENQRNMIDVKNQMPYINQVFSEIHPKDKNQFRSHMPTYNPLAMQGNQIVWQTSNWVTGIPTPDMKPYNPQLKSATQRFGRF